MNRSKPTKETKAREDFGSADFSRRRTPVETGATGSVAVTAAATVADLA